MPQEFQVLHCYACSTFQVHQVKKSLKWACKMCGEKQSVKKVFGRGTGSECRQHVQKWNRMKGELNESSSMIMNTNSCGTILSDSTPNQLLDVLHNQQTKPGMDKILVLFVKTDKILVLSVKTEKLDETIEHAKINNVPASTGDGRWQQYLEAEEQEDVHVSPSSEWDEEYTTDRRAFDQIRKEQKQAYRNKWKEMRKQFGKHPYRQVSRHSDPDPNVLNPSRQDYPVQCNDGPQIYKATARRLQSLPKHRNSADHPPHSELTAVDPIHTNSQHADSPARFLQPLTCHAGDKLKSNADSVQVPRGHPTQSNPTGTAQSKCKQIEDNSVVTMVTGHNDPMTEGAQYGPGNDLKTAGALYGPGSIILPGDALAEITNLNSIKSAGQVSLNAAADIQDPSDRKSRGSTSKVPVNSKWCKFLDSSEVSDEASSGEEDTVPVVAPQSSYNQSNGLLQMGHMANCSAGQDGQSGQYCTSKVLHKSNPPKIVSLSGNSLNANSYCRTATHEPSPHCQPPCPPVSGESKPTPIPQFCVEDEDLDSVIGHW